MSTTPSAVKRALSVIQTLQTKIESLESENQSLKDSSGQSLGHGKQEAIAIVGMACRFPGGADTPEAYWHLLESAKDAIIPVPKNRWDVDAFYHSDQDLAGKMYTRNGGYLEEVDQFDAQFFGISPREAASMDPQQRLALELAWEALENANIPVDSLYNTETGVFIGISNFEYGAHLLWSGDEERINAYAGTGGSLGVAAGRLSYILGLTGPSMIVDTACSSSLVTTHLACQSLRAGECNVALSAGVNLILGPQTSINFCKAKMLSPEGRCKTFSASADGYARGEGGGLIVLKRLSDAQRDGDKVLAVIQGSAVNQDGPSGGLTVPNGPAQTRVIENALRNAGLEASQVSYVEAHGTGTPLGDPIEIQALHRAYKNRPLCKENETSVDLLVGSVKTNFGHLESAAGIAGLIKSVLILQHQQVPAHLHFDTPSPHIAWADVAVKVCSKLQPLPKNEMGVSVVGVSSFSFAGTNAHLLLGSAPMQSDLPAAPPVESPSRSWQVLPLAAKDTAALQALALSYQETLSEKHDLREVAYTAAVGRAELACRAVVVGENIAQIKKALSGLPNASGAAKTGVEQSQRGNEKGNGKIAFLFTGQGCQYPGMGKELYQSSTVFRGAIDRCAELLNPDLERSLVQLIFNTDDAQVINQTANTQPLLFALQYSLLCVWQSWGIRANAVLGHSVGEYAAACAAGVMSLQDGCALISARGRLMQTRCESGSMLSVSLDQQAIQKYLSPFGERLALAAVNGPQRVVVSGETEAIELLEETLAAQEIETRSLAVSHGFHSAMMNPMLEPFSTLANSLNFNRPNIPLYSNLSGQLAGEEITTAQYWLDHVSSTVRFNDGVQALLADGYRTFVEIGAKPTLCAMVGDIAEHINIDHVQCLPSLRAKRSNWQTMLESLGTLWVRGEKVNWHAVNGNSDGSSDGKSAGLSSDNNRRQARLPNYPFQRRSHWINWSLGQGQPNSSASKENTSSEGMPDSAQAKHHVLLGTKFDSPGLDPSTQIFSNQLNPKKLHLLAHHRIFGAIILPAAAHVEMALSAATQQFGSGTSILLEDVQIEHALVLAEQHATPVQLILKREQADHYSFQLFSQLGEPDNSWTRHTQGVFRRGPEQTAPVFDLDKIRASCDESLSIEDYYARTRAVGIEHGEKFQALNALWQGEDDESAMVLAHLRLPEQAGNSDFLIHPVLLDAAFQMVGVPLLERGQPYLPVGFDRLLRYESPSEELWCVVRIVEEIGRLFIADINLLNNQGRCVVAVTGLRFQRVAVSDLALNQSQHQADFYCVDRVYTPGFGAASNQLPDAETLASQLNVAMNDAIEPVRFYGQLFPVLDRLVAAYGRQALIELGVDWQVGSLLVVEALMHSLAILPMHHRLLERMLVILSEQHWLVKEGSAWKIKDQGDHTGMGRDIKSLAQEIAETFPQAALELDIVKVCGAGLADVLVGRVGGLQLLFPEGDLSAATRLYAESPGAIVINKLLKQSFSKAIENLSDENGLRVLELGAGTGGTTAHLLPELQGLLGAERCQYLFTDISPHFAEQARLRFEKFSFLDFAELDIETDPSIQGYVEESYDIIVAANVLHATRDLTETLTHVYQLLAPGGLLILLEGSAQQPWLDITFGLTEGWWRFTDTEQRADYPLMEGESWCSLLKRCGFETASIVSPDVASGELLLRQAIITAQKPMTEKFHGQWLLLADESNEVDDLHKRLSKPLFGELFGELSGELIEQLESQGGTCLVSSQVSDLVEQLNDQVKGVIVTASLSANESACESLIELYQGMDQAQLINRPQVLIAAPLAAGGVQRQGAEGQYAAAIISIAQVAAAEHPEWKNTCVEIDTTDLSPSQTASMILQELTLNDDHVILSEGKRYQPQLSRRTKAQWQSGEAITLRDDKSYLITGGLGGLGLLTAKWLVEEKGVRNLILAGRSGPGEIAQRQITEIEQFGAKVQIVACDVTCAEQVKTLIETCNELAPLVGVIHAAGILDDGAVTNLTWQRFMAAYEPKAMGAWNLHQASLDLTLDFFIMYSSLASLYCPSGQASHAASNSALDALAQQRAALGLSAMTINWGAWTEIGQVGQQGIDRQLEGKGIGTISPLQGQAMLSLIFSSPDQQLVIAPMNWQRFFDSGLPWVNRSLFTQLRQSLEIERNDSKPVLPPDSESVWLDSLQGLPIREQKARVEQLIKLEAARVLGLDSADWVATDVGFFDLGMDSLTSVELRKSLQHALQTKLATTTLFKHPTVNELVIYIVDEVLNLSAENATITDLPEKDASSSENSAISKATNSLNKNASTVDLQAMSDEELSAMIDAELNDVLEDSV